MKKIFCFILAVSICVLSCATLYSCSEKKDKVTVTFHKNDSIAFYNGNAVQKSVFDGGVYKSFSVEKGSYVTPPEAPSPSGVSSVLGACYVFGGWYKEPSCENAFDFNSEPVNVNLHLYAKWIQTR